MLRTKGGEAKDINELAKALKEANSQQKKIELVIQVVLN